ncbi:uncharacterized protein LOC100904354 [Galendromus occidentalis]|uniref:Uncharacterized protein LOC100904354 n=1 Tax=Galendromus occidentalis TaxID=34638 RepID=A0AAJ6QM20_9ACAR|nr:uncharacterized protein LOC100904354 [Galendromus occidentalis]
MRNQKSALSSKSLAKMTRTPMKVAALLALAAIGSAASVFDANDMMDRILTEMGHEASRLELDPIRAYRFELTVKGSGLGGEIKAHFPEAVFTGLGSITRAERCSHLVRGSNLKMKCYVSLSEIKFAMHASLAVDGPPAKDLITTESSVGSDVLALIGIERTNGRVTVNVIKPPTFALTTKVVRGELPFEDLRYSDFERELHAEISKQLVTILDDRYRYDMEYIAGRTLDL